MSYESPFSERRCMEIFRAAAESDPMGPYSVGSPDIRLPCLYSGFKKVKS